MTRKKKVVLVAVLTATALSVLGLWARLGPLPDGFLDREHFVSTRVLDRNGEVLFEALSGTETRTAWIEPNEVPASLVMATLAAEDHRFFDHPGVDLLAITRSTLANIRARGLVQGGSTITQQLVKQIRIARGERPVRTRLSDKAKEMILALRVEHRLTKNEILAYYLNIAPYGNQYVGVRRAATGYFNRDPSMLTLAQAAFLAGLPRRPSGYDPYRHFDRATDRQLRILDRIDELGLAEPSDSALARDEHLTLVRSKPEALAPHLVQRVLSESPARREIRTTIDADLQRSVQGIIDSYRLTLDKHGAHNVAVVVLDNTSGEWLAWEGSGNYFDALHGGAIDGVTTPRQPGSALKPFTYALAFEKGSTPATILPDVPSHFPTATEGVLYTPRNYDGRFRGPLRARVALASSQNVPAVALASDIGVPELVRFLRRSGFKTFDMNAEHYGLGITLGNAEVRLDELVSAYAMLARGGEPVSPAYLQSDRVATGADPVVTRRTAHWITSILSDDNARSLGFGRGSSLEFPFDVAVKTGTSQAYHDNWTVGYTPGVTVGVWVGNFDRRVLRLSSGLTGAAPIFHSVMLAAVALTESNHSRAMGFEAESVGLHDYRICDLTGLLATDRCPATVSEELATTPQPCDWHHIEDGETTVIWPQGYESWARQAGLVRERTNATPLAPEPASGPASSGTPRPRLTTLRITSPPTGATYLIDPTLRKEFQTLPLRVATGGATDRVEWTHNGTPLRTISSDQTIDWPLEPGKHHFVASIGTRKAETTIVVR